MIVIVFVVCIVIGVVCVGYGDVFGFVVFEEFVFEWLGRVFVLLCIEVLCVIYCCVYYLVVC